MGPDNIGMRLSAIEEKIKKPVVGCIAAVGLLGCCVLSSKIEKMNQFETAGLLLTAYALCQGYADSQAVPEGKLAYYPEDSECGIVSCIKSTPGCGDFIEGEDGRHFQFPGLDSPEAAAAIDVILLRYPAYAKLKIRDKKPPRLYLRPPQPVNTIPPRKDPELPPHSTLDPRITRAPTPRGSR